MEFEKEILCPSAEGKTINAYDFSVLPENENNFEQLKECLKYCAAHNISELIIPPGRYFVTSQDTLMIHGRKNFSILADGAEFVFQNTTQLIRIQDCEKILIQGLSFSWNWDAARLASVVKTKRLTLDYIDFEYLEEGEIDLSLPWVTMNAMDPGNMTVGVEDGLEYGVYQNDTDSFIKKEKIGDKLYRCYQDMRGCSPLLFKLDSMYLVRHFLYNGTVFMVQDSSHVTFDHVSIYSGSGMGYSICGHTHHLRFNRCRVTLRENPPGRISTTADAVHVAQSNGCLLFENCDFGYHGDDCINIHDNVLMYIKKLSANTILLQNRRKIFFDSGDRIEFRNGDLSPTGFISTIAAKTITDEGTELTFSEPLPDSIQENSVLFNRSYGSDHYVIRNCYFHETRARGVLAQANNGLIENCRFFRTQGAAVQIETGASPTWSEGMGVDSLTLRGNIFDHCDYNDWGKAVIYMSTFLPEGITIQQHGSENPTTTLGDSGADYRTAYPMFTNITIEGNRFLEYPRRAMILTSFDGITIKNNQFINHESRKKNNPERGSIWAELGSNAVFEGNLYQASPYTADTFLEYDRKTAKNIVLK